MKRRWTAYLLAWVLMAGLSFTQAVAQHTDPLMATSISKDVLLDIDVHTVGDPDLTLALGRLDTALRFAGEREIEGEQTAVGLLDLKTGRLAMLRADTQYYAASVPKIAILLAYFQTQVKLPAELDQETRHELGLMIKRSDNALAAKYSKIVGLQGIADVLTLPFYRLYDPMHGGGLWVGKHYGKSDERLRDPLAGESHAATVRQLLRYYLMLEHGRLVNPEASKVMREIFDSPDLEHLQSKVVLGLADRDVKIRRKSGTWTDWHADTAVVTGEDRHYIIAVLTHHEQGAEYIIDLARSIDDWAIAGFKGEAPVSLTPEPNPDAD